MSTTVRISYDQFEEMARRGDFADAEERLELIFGEIRATPAPDPPHEYATDTIAEWSYDNAPRESVRSVSVIGSRRSRPTTRPPTGCWADW